MKNKILVLVILSAIIIGGWFVFKKSTNQSNTSTKELIPISAISHGHGLGVDLENPDKVYIATHYGLDVFDSGKLYQMGNKKDDYMGFSQHPTDPKIFFASGHPSSGGNIGFQKSENGGFDWQKISDGVDGPVDFHAMAVSPANPDYAYGWYKGSVQRSTDGGKHWEIVNKNILAVQLTADSQDAQTVYATNPAGQGILASHDAGTTWLPLSSDLARGSVSGIAVDPKNASHMLVFSETLGGLAQSHDHGATWKKVPASFDGTLLFISFFRKNPAIVYALAHTNTLYKSIDGGESWNKIAEGVKE